MTNEIVIKVKRHHAAVMIVVAIILLLYFGESYADSGNCSTRNPNIDCSQKGLIDISKMTPYNFTETTGIGSHWIVVNGIPQPIPEFRGTANNIYGNYQHVVCDLGNSTCEWHLDKYPATGDIPFGFVLHFADFLTLQSWNPFSEDVWQGIIWGSGVFGFYLIARETERKFE